MGFFALFGGIGLLMGVVNISQRKAAIERAQQTHAEAVQRAQQAHAEAVQNMAVRLRAELASYRTQQDRDYFWQAIREHTTEPVMRDAIK